MLAGAGAHAAPAGRGGTKDKGKADGGFRLGIENLLEADVLETLRDARVGLITNPTGTDS